MSLKDCVGGEASGFTPTVSVNSQVTTIDPQLDEKSAVSVGLLEKVLPYLVTLSESK